MKKKIFLCLAAFSLMLMIFTSLAMGGIYYRFYQNAVESALQGDAALMAQQLEEGGDPLAVLTSQQKALDPGLRISYIRADGTVLFDTDAQAESLENHADRQEILLAREPRARARPYAIPTHWAWIPTIMPSPSPTGMCCGSASRSAV